MTNTTIAVRKETKELLKHFGGKGDTYDDVIQKMSATYEEFVNTQYNRLTEKHKFKKMDL
ncbi:MAG: hypothetical protein V1836_01980 [Candidatus Aenigmatarchaeota archaeon]